MPSDERTASLGSPRGPRTTEHLTSAQRALFRVMRDWQYGRIENMRVERGEPVLGSGARLVRIARLDGGRQRFDTAGEEQCQLKQEIHNLFEELTRLQDCLVLRLEFRNGLPMRLETVPLDGTVSESIGDIPRAETHSPRGSRKVNSTSNS